MNTAMWESCVITGIRLAIHVDRGALMHANRPFHGFILNDPDGQRRYDFRDGVSMLTRANDFFYLPRGSTYTVHRTPERPGSCYAINFEIEGDWADAPFAISLRDADGMRRAFADAARVSREKRPFSQIRLRSILYDILCRAAEEAHRSYLPQSTRSRILIAEEIIALRYTDSMLTVSELAQACGISEAYFRRIFTEAHGTAPAAYIAALRLERAKELLSSQRITAAQTAELCGYGDPAYFSREFRRRTGMTPTEFRTAAQNGETVD